MASFNWNSRTVFDSNIARYFDGFGDNSKFLPLGDGAPPPPPSSSSSSLVLDSQKGELVRAPAKSGQKVKSEAKVVAALKNHSDAERRRRERINSHLNMLRSLVPSTEKMDKASLLGEVIDHVKELKRTTTEACEGLVIPMDVDKVIVEPHEDSSEGLFCIRASLFCEDRPEIFSDLKQALVSLNLKTVKAEISTLEGRMKNVFVLQGFNVDNIDDAKVRQLIACSVRQSFTSILEKYSCSTELSPRISFPNKRRKFSLFDSSSCSS